MVEAYLKNLALVYRDEVPPAFEGMADENVWRRPADGLLSVGEVAGHIAYWQAIKLAGNGENTENCAVTSPLIDARFRYYTSCIAAPPSEQHRAMTAEQVCSELLRIRQEAVAHFERQASAAGGRTVNIC